ncbi:MAG: Crp/Fnr family transcriptional regulator [Acidobacteria bacterium]|nr:Crp/Fnr family transcriptional regulator [Acidobacteriota bacterium]
MRQDSVYPAAAVLFVEGQPARGLFLICSGKVKLTASSPQGRSLIVRVAEPGEVLGLSAVISNADYEVSAQTLEPAQISFLPRPDFLRFLGSYGEVSVRVAEHLSMELRRAYHQVARIALAPTARAKLAGLLLDWASQDSQPAPKGVRFHLRLTQEEIGELIGSSRETVSRLLNDLRRKGLIDIKGTLVTLPEPRKLEALFT